MDSVTWALAADAIANDGPARVARLPTDVCAHRFGPGFDDAATDALLGAAAPLAASRYDSQPKVRREPKLRPWVKRRTG